MSLFSYFIITLSFVFIISTLLEKMLIPFFRLIHAGQPIYETGPSWHKSKSGTPTMGGLAFLVAVTVTLTAVFLIALSENTVMNMLPLIFTLLFAVLNSSVGVLDDIKKLKQKRNEGLTPFQKLILQTAFAGMYLALMRIYGFIDEKIAFPFFNTEIDLGFFYYFLMIFMIVGIVNCANLTDGIDGLASSVAFIIGCAFAFFAFRFLSFNTAVLSGAIIGSAISFLIFNHHPALIFMGDTGSLFFGALTVGAAFTLGKPLIILFLGIIYVIEGVSDVLQVIHYKRTGKRIFKMAPLHHHFEKSGWTENQICLLFGVITVAASAIAYFAF